MSLESGTYHIFSADGNYPIGRRPTEDKSFMPKGIFKLPMGTESVWEVEKIENGNYFLRNRGAIVGPDDGLLVAFVIEPGEEIAKTEWSLRPDVKRGEDAFIVFETSGHLGLGWVLPESSELVPYPQVKVAGLIFNPTEPPTYPANEVFIFKKVDA